MKKIFLSIALVLVLLIALPSVSARAQDFNILPVCAESGSCGICDFFDLLANATEIGFKILGAAAFFFFILSGILLIDSAGNSEKRGKALGMMKNTVIGVLLVIISWMIINAIILILITPSKEQGEKNECGGPFTACLFKNPWNQFCENSANTGPITHFCFDHAGKDALTTAPKKKDEGWDKSADCTKTLDVSCVGKGDGKRCGLKKSANPDVANSPNPIAHYNAGEEYRGICLDQICQIQLHGTPVVKYHGKQVRIESSGAEPTSINSCDYLRAISPEKYLDGGRGYKCTDYKAFLQSTKKDENKESEVKYARDCIKDICPTKTQACCGYVRIQGSTKPAEPAPGNEKKAEAPTASPR